MLSHVCWSKIPILLAAQQPGWPERFPSNMAILGDRMRPHFWTISHMDPYGCYLLSIYY